MQLRELLSSVDIRERALAAEELGKLESMKAVQVLRQMLESDDENAWRLAIYGLRTGGSREGWLSLESIAQKDANNLGSSDTLTVDLAFRRLMAMGRTKMMDRLFRAADGHSKSIPGVVAKEFSARAVSTLSHPQRLVMELRLGIRNSTSATPADTADSLGISLNDVREFELAGWQSIHSPIQLDID
ncbi:uncharacterized protein METZ01_LOCUS49578 [marine metagenome]|uniref:RNA polymerase sigma-70 region 4 domain-containing protein n=1 Tax=marine metagenome TaxID=408172 RepID=A0A381RZW6_9ZZZZ